MAKKAKKAKITGTPDVVKFKSTRGFNVLKGIVSLQEQRVLMSTDFLEESEYTRISRLLHLLGLLAQDLGVEPDHEDPHQTISDDEVAIHPKDYRIHLHHALLSPSPQLFPIGFTVEVVRLARAVIEKPSLVANRREYLYREDLREACDDFLKNLDRRVIEMSSFIEVKVKGDFKDGLKNFKAEIAKQLSDFDAAWRNFENFLLQEKLRVHKLIYEEVEKLVAIEFDISDLEMKLGTCAKGDSEGLSLKKAELESEFTKIASKLINELIGVVTIRAESVTLAESCLFYGGERIPGSNAGVPVLKAHMELRHLLASGLRLQPELKNNDAFMRALGNFKTAIENASQALDAAEKLPRVPGVKHTGFFTKDTFLESITA